MTTEDRYIERIVELKEVLRGVLAHHEAWCGTGMDGAGSDDQEDPVGARWLHKAAKLLGTTNAPDPSFSKQEEA